MISIIIPTLNEEVLLPELLEQLNTKELRASFDYEVIVSDGGSTDSTLEIADRLADKVIKSSASSDNIAVGRNNGASISKGNILFFINADVRIEEPMKFFATICNDFQESNYLAMTSLVETFPEEACYKDKIFHGFCNSYFYLLNAFGVGMGRGECNIIKKEVFLSVEGYNPKLVAGEDFDLFKRVAKNGKILFCRNLKVFESPRRYRKVGYLNVILSWFYNSVSIVLSKKSLSTTWEQIR